MSLGRTRTTLISGRLICSPSHSEPSNRNVGGFGGRSIPSGGVSHSLNRCAFIGRPLVDSEIDRRRVLLGRFRQQLALLLAPLGQGDDVPVLDRDQRPEELDL